MNDTTIKRMIRQQRPEPSEHLDARLTRQMAALRGEKRRGPRRKVSLAMVLALVLMLLLTAGALAEMLGLNLFALFGRQDQRLEVIAPDTAPASQEPLTVADDALGQTVAEITGGYFDGSSLLVSYTLRGSERLERFTPTEEQRASLRVMAEELTFSGDTEEERVIQAAWLQAQRDGTPMGFIRYSVYPSDHTETEDGIDLPPANEQSDVTAEGVTCVIREYETPLPEAVSQRESLQVRIRLWRSVSAFYFDGEVAYELPAQREAAGEMTATLTRQTDGTLHLTGDAVDGDAPVHGEATVSRVSGSVTVQRTQTAYPAPPEDGWYDVLVTDDTGRLLRTNEVGLSADGREITAAFDGTGVLPKTLTVRVVVCQEGDWDRDAAMADAAPIVLMP